LPSSIKGRLKGRSPFKSNPSPSPSKERGTKGVRLTKNYLPFLILREGGVKVREGAKPLQ